jgi:biopolymer transport protein ExbB/TolQ
MGSLLEWYGAGGVVMHLLLVTAFLGIGVFAERWYVIVLRSRISGRAFIEKVIQLVRSEKAEEAIKICARSKAALADMGLLILRSRSHDESDLRTVTAAAAKAVIPRLTRRLPYLRSLATVALLLGALGVVLQLSHTFSIGSAPGGDGVSSVWPGVAVALHAMEFALGVAIVLRVADAYLESQSALIIEQVDEFSMRLINALTDRPDVRLGHR